MSEDYPVFKENVDGWIKQMRHELTEMKSYSRMVDENTNNIQHNYELFHELRRELQEVKQELNALKVLHMMTIRKSIIKKMD